MNYLGMKEKSNKKTKQVKPKDKGRNGKGDSPRNISMRFKKNYEQINWSKKP